MIVFVPCGLVPIGIKPFTYYDHRSGKLSGAYPDRDAAHDPSECVSQMWTRRCCNLEVQNSHQNQHGAF
jgi:hypothetical protein